MKKLNKQKKRLKIFSLLFMSILIAFTPIFANLNKDVVNSVFASTTTFERETDLITDNKLLHEKSYYKGTAEDNFEGGTVIITLNEKESHKFKAYTPKDFPEIDCIAVKDLTEYTLDYAKEQIQNKKAGITKNENAMLLKVDNFRRILSLKLSDTSKENVVEAIKKLEKRQEILSAGPNGIHTICGQPNDQLFLEHQWGLQNINAPAAWDITTGSSTVTVGVIDTGIDASHPDLVNRMSTAGLHRDFTSGTPVVVETPTDPYGHGTHVAGIIGAEGNNSIGVTGVAWDVSLVSLKVFSENNDGFEENAINAINFATSQNIPILNYSAGEYTYYAGFYSALATYEGLFITAAGNENKNNDLNPIYPASYDLPNIISVGASDSNDNRSDWAPDGLWNLWGLIPGHYKSNYGIRSVDIFAPGSRIASTLNMNRYGYYSGTSMAAPFVAGVAALIMSIKPDMSALDIKDCILYGADTIDSLGKFSVTSGRLNAFKALQLAQEGTTWWEQPTWTSNSNTDGTVSASSNTSGRQPYGAFDGWIGTTSAGNSNGYPAAQWTADGTSGWLELKLDYYVKVSKIYFYNRASSTSEYTKDAYFTGTNNVALGEHFLGVKSDNGVSVIEVDEVVTDIIKLNIVSSYGSSYVGAGEIRILATPAEAPPIYNTWQQHIWTSSANSHGTITASGTYSNEQPWKAYNGTMNGGSQGNGDNWSVNKKTGWLQLKLNYHIEVHSIVFYNGVSTQSNRTKEAKFTGRGGIPLGEGFVAPNYNFGYVFVPVGGVVTDVIQLNISSSYGAYVNASMIIINASLIETPPTPQNWMQPIWNGSANTHGTVLASGSYKSEHPWKAYNGTMNGGSGGNGDNWSVNAKSGWLELVLDYPIYVTGIELYGNSSGGNNRTKAGNFTGMDGVALGSAFTLANQNFAYQYVSVSGVWTNVIRLNITSSYGSYVGASLIIIHGTY